MLVINIIIVVSLTALSALFSGLTLGLMGLRSHELRRKIILGSKNAAAIYSVRKDGNLLLTTLLLGNVLVNSILSIYLGSLTGGVIATISATVIIVIFGEILPQAVFSRYALRYGARFVPIVRLFIFIMYPFAKPISATLDRVLGGELPSAVSKKELGIILEEQRTHQKTDLDEQEIEILQSGLLFADLEVREIMTPLKEAYFVDAHMLLDEASLRSIHDMGFSRMPVYDKEQERTVGILYAKDLVRVMPEERSTVHDVMRPHAHTIRASAKLNEVLNRFKRTRTHLFIVHEGGEVAGIVTLEDVLEEIVGDIIDEHDVEVEVPER